MELGFCIPGEGGPICQASGGLAGEGEASCRRECPGRGWALVLEDSVLECGSLCPLLLSR